MKVMLAVVADAANISVDDKLNILGIFQSLSASSVPARHPQMVVVVCLTAEPSERGRSYNMDVVMVDEDGKTVQQFPPMPFTVPPEGPSRSTTIRALAEIRDLIFPKFGEYTLDILVDNHAEGRVQIVLGQANLTLPFPSDSNEQGR
jgi:hypothetical protein